METTPDLPVVEYAERSDPGRDPDKQVNEDACGHRETRFGHLCVVCDGMGGHASGREAAQLALATIFEVFAQAPEGTPAGALLKSAVEEASRRVHVMATSEVAMGRPGSTAVAIVVHAQGTEVVHVGDSRAYLVHAGQIFRITRDHSMVQEMVDRGLLTPQQAAHHPDANRITRALGMAPQVESELRPEPVLHVPGDAFVLCSDGLSDLVEDHEILGIVGSEPAAQAAGKLVDLANARGGHDNITVIILRTREAAAAVAAPVAPTVAQTSVMADPDEIPNAPPAMAQGRAERMTEPLVAAPVVLPPAPAPPPPLARELRTRRGVSPGMVITLALAIVAVILLGIVLAMHLLDLGGRTTPTGDLPMPASDAAADGPTSIAPGSVVLPPPNAPFEPIEPLQPSPSTTRRGGH